MGKKLSLNWYIYDNETDYEYRYCHNCGKKVEFKDSLKRRRNANGKNIYYFAIYKCPKGHTWNKQISVYKAIPLKAETEPENNGKEISCTESKYEELCISALKKEGIQEVEIILKEINIKIRLDKFLAFKITDMSRAKILKYIQKGYIRVNGNVAKPDCRLKQKDVIYLYIA